MYPFRDVQNSITKSVQAGSKRIGLEVVSRRVLGLRGRYRYGDNCSLLFRSFGHQNLLPQICLQNAFKVTEWGRVCGGHSGVRG